MTFLKCFCFVFSVFATIVQLAARFLASDQAIPRALPCFERQDR